MMKQLDMTPTLFAPDEAKHKVAELIAIFEDDEFLGYF